MGQFIQVKELQRKNENKKKLSRYIETYLDGYKSKSDCIECDQAV